MHPPTITHQQKKVTVVKGKPIFYETEELETARSKLQAHLSKHIPDKPSDGPLQCNVKWLFHSNVRKAGELKYMKPDNHNLNKLLFDVMEDLGYWVNDARVASEIIQKFWVNGSPPGISELRS